MKKFKRITSAVAALALAATMVAPVAMNTFVANAATSVKVTEEANHTYTAYQIFKGEFKDNIGLVVSGWNENDINTAGLFADPDWTDFVIEDAVEAGPEGDPAGKEAVVIGGETKADAVARLLEKVQSNSAKAIELAKIIGKYVKGNGTALSAEAKVLEGGYYIIIDKYTSVEGSSDIISLNILKVAGKDEDITLSPKKSAPDVDKQVQENSKASQANEGYGKGADYNIGDEVPFRLIGTLPEQDDFDAYNAYRYVFHDTLDEHFVPPTSETSKIKVTIKEDGKDPVELSGGYTVAYGTDTECATKCSVEVKFVDIKSIIKEKGFTAAANIVVDYVAELKDNAVIGGTGQNNKVYLEYSNNPNLDNSGGKGTTDETTEKEVYVYTYEIDSTKKDATDKNTPLSGAEFKLRNKDGKYAKLKGGNGVWTFDGWDETGDGTLMRTGTDGKFNIKGLDQGVYYLEEINAPGGYNKLDEDVVVEIKAKIDDEAGTLTDLRGSKYNNGTEYQEGEGKNGIVSGDVYNAKGTSLPSTGGIGTTIFYLGGGAIVAVAGALLITKKRMGKAEEE